MRYLKVRTETGGEGELGEISLWVFRGEWKARKENGRIYLSYGSITLEMDPETFNELRNALS
ncbi:hypothetical protein [Archaeoglobus veneficus]|uniref:Uncharacterized protein n=1 Tax=Archaeoglobus veneficus (strain DSM 11195 / SNP6) TaxID=693661 RepID=F2KRI1_ARCVS|nr:hypothetical protein [Archaeoglobus veneficus]AEA46746.1 hypothetical protein Arcve_0727 [Archaeoglobus veneficus SNP6]